MESDIGSTAAAKPAAIALSAALTATLLAILALGACASAPAVSRADRAQEREVAGAAPAVDPVSLLDRVSWGATDTELERLRTDGRERWLERQLRPDPNAALPAPVAAQIAAMTIETTPMPQLVLQLERQRKDAAAIKDDDAHKAAQQAFQQEMNRVAREAATRALLRDLYSPNQLQEQMTWFWVNHFNVHQYKHMVRPMLGDYEQALRAHALGRFRDLLAVTVRHPAMLTYLDNAQNGAHHVNENYARELLELHTLGVDGGYTQHDVQELARVLTGFGVDLKDPGDAPPKVRRELAGQYVRDGLFEFNPNRHDYGDKVILGRTIRGRGRDELDEVIDLLSRHPATARHLSVKLARYFVADEPPPALVDRMAREFERSDGDIAAVLRVVFESPEFAASLRNRFKDPVHYVVSAVRLAYDGKPILNAGPMINWLNRMGEGLYNRATPDGYPLTESAWTGPGQLAVRFEIARAIGSGSAGLFKSDGPAPMERAAFPQLANALYYGALKDSLAAATVQALDQAASPQEWNMLLLSSPEFMMR